MNRNNNDYIAIYKKQLETEDLQIAYEMLIKYIMSLKTYCEKELSNKYTFGNVSPGYMDFTYFPFFNPFLRDKKLRFGIVLNHKYMRFELWLMGQNAAVQNKYWNLLKFSKWNKDNSKMPKYAVLEAVLVESPNFNVLDALTSEIVKSAECISAEIIRDIRDLI